MKNKSRSHSVKTISVIAQLLGAEGWSEHISSLIRSYAVRRHGTERQRERFVALKKEFGNIMMQKLTYADRIIVGKFISTMNKLHMDTGLRMGLMTHLQEGEAHE